MKTSKSTILISTLALIALSFASCSNNNDQAAIEKRRADSIDSVNKVLQGTNAEVENNNNSNNNNGNQSSAQDKTQLAASLKVINDDISVCDANISSGTVTITVNTAKKMDKNLTQKERDEANEKLAAAVLLVKMNTEKKSELEKQRDALQREMNK